MLRSKISVTTLLGLSLCACSVFEPPIEDQNNEDGAVDGDASMMDDGSMDGAADGSIMSCVVETIMSIDDCTGDIVINEVDGSGNDFIEIYNRTNEPKNISNYVITDGTDDTPSVAEGIVVPVGTILPPHGYIYVWANLPSPQPGLRTTDCIPGSPPPCLHSGWGISAAGEMSYLLDDTLTVVCKFKYPSAVFGSEAFGRVSDGSTTLCPTGPTPGEANVASPDR